jgi:hypothetical protein
MALTVSRTSDQLNPSRTPHQVAHDRLNYSRVAIASDPPLASSRTSLARVPWPARGLTTKNTQISKGKTNLWHGTRACRVAMNPFRVKIVYEGERKWYTR